MDHLSQSTTTCPNCTEFKSRFQDFHLTLKSSLYLLLYDAEGRKEGFIHVGPCALCARERVISRGHGSLPVQAIWGRESDSMY